MAEAWPEITAIHIRSPKSLPSARRAKVALVIRLLGGRGGGAERMYCELANFLSEDGYEVTCLYFDESPEPPFFPLSPQVKRINLAPVGGAGLASVRGLTRVRRAIFGRLTSGPLGPLVNRRLWGVLNNRFVAQLRDYYRFGAPDAVISFLPTANTPALAAAVDTNTRVIVTNHNVPAEDYTSPLRWDPSPYDRRLRLDLLKNAAIIHVLFPRFGEWFPAPLRDRIVAIPNYVPKDILSTQPNETRSKTILGVGRLSPTKNYATLIEAWQLIAHKHRDWKVVLYGEGPQRGRLEKMVKEGGLESSVELPGQHASLGSEYGRASILCHPALFEGFGLSVAEALALGMPVVAFSDCAGVNEFLVDDHNGLLIDRESGSQGLAAGLSKLILDAQLRERLGANGPASVARFDEAIYRKSWVKLIEEVTGGIRTT